MPPTICYDNPPPSCYSVCTYSETEGTLYGPATVSRIILLDKGGYGFAIAGSQQR